MSAADQRKRSQEMAKYMLDHGIWHGRRMTTTNAPTPYQSMPTLPGSAANRRLLQKRTK